jgi:hypothetical protein
MTPEKASLESEKPPRGKESLNLKKPCKVLHVSLQKFTG